MARNLVPSANELAGFYRASDLVNTFTLRHYAALRSYERELWWTIYLFIFDEENITLKMGLRF